MTDRFKKLSKQIRKRKEIGLVHILIKLKKKQKNTINKILMALRKKSKIKMKTP